MATASQIKALIKSHYSDNNEQFETIALQLASHEARLGHHELAGELKKLVDSSKTSIKHLAKQIPSENILFQANMIDELIIYSTPHMKLDDLVMPSKQKERIFKIINEFHNQDKLKKHGLMNRRKILLAGHPGTGKTMTASILASELSLPLCIIQIDKIITKFMGETSAKLRQIFKFIELNRGVYFFDEFDAIGTDRAKENEVGEMRRVLNAFLQFLEGDQSESLIVTATNNIALLDKALFRRFDDVLDYELPSKEEILELLNQKLSYFKIKFSLDTMANECIGLSHADIVRACTDTIKDMVINDKETVTKLALSKSIEDIKNHYSKVISNKK